MTRRIFGPKPPDSPSVGMPCPGCHQPFAAGDMTVLVVIGPGDDEEERAKARAGRPYNAILPSRSTQTVRTPNDE